MEQGRSKPTGKKAESVWINNLEDVGRAVRSESQQSEVALH